MAIPPRVALQDLEWAFRNYFEATHQREPNIGILVITLDSDDISLQYIGREPRRKVDWAKLFMSITEQLQAGGYSIHDAAEIKFQSQR